MEVLFIRLSHANNSSSDHSLIFIKNENSLPNSSENKTQLSEGNLNINFNYDATEYEDELLASLSEYEIIETIE